MRNDPPSKGGRGHVGFVVKCQEITMSEDLISVIDVARQTGRRKASIFKVLKRLSIEPTKMRSSASRGQLISYITIEEFRQVLSEMESPENLDIEADEENESVPEILLTEQGFFYLLMLEPDHDPGRFKVGFTVNLSERLRALRCSAPFVKAIHTWPCKRLWEKTAIECVTEGCSRLHTEVFRAQSLESIKEKCEKFFELMPKLPFKNSCI